MRSGRPRPRKSKVGGSYAPFPPTVVDQLASLWVRCAPTGRHGSWLFGSMAVLLRLRSGFDHTHGDGSGLPFLLRSRPRLPRRPGLLRDPFFVHRGSGT